MKKRKIAIVFLIILFVCICTISFVFFKKQKYPNIKVAYIYETKLLGDYYQYYEQSLLANLSLSKIDISEGIPDLSDFDLVFPDSSIINSKDLTFIKSTLENYISDGGNVLTTFQTRDLISTNAYGGGKFVKIPFDTDIKYPKVNNDYVLIQDIMKDYADAVLLFQDYETVKNRTLVYALDSPNAKNIVSTKDDLGIITESKFGKGNVYYVGGILPTNIFNTSFDLKSKTSKLEYFNDTANASNHLLFTEIASVVSKNKLGFSLKRVFGSNGRPSIAHQNHFEVLSAVKKGSIEKWIEMCEENNQIASYSLAVGMYEWYNRFESIGYALNKSDTGYLDFTGDRINNFYAWGTHPVVDNKWLNINKSDENISYFIDTKLPTRAYPFVFDFNNDGAMDIISGSSDGLFHVYTGVYNDINNEWTLKNSGYLKTSSGENLSVSSYSSPTIIDFDNDGILDLISGSKDGNIYFFKGVGSLNFLDKQILIKYTDYEIEYNLSAPDVVDINNDGILDIVCGYGNGDIYIYDGSKNLKYTFLGNVGKYAAPRGVDLTKDGYIDIAVGIQDGYIAQFIQHENIFYDGGFIDELDYYNNKGNTNLKSGNNIVPFFVDLDKNGSLDLVCGLLEYGEFAVNISDKNFPYKEELKNAISFSKEHFVPIIPHIYTHAYKIEDEEIESLLNHKSIFELYGLEWENTGANQHTWFTSSSQSANQTLKNEYTTGIAWNFGYRPANSPALPADYVEYKMITPFYLKIHDNKSMLLYNANFKHEDELFKTSAKYDLPVTVYRHSEYDTTEKPDVMLQHIKSVNDFKEKYNYNFVTENQMAMAISAAYNTDIIVEYRPLFKFLNSFKKADNTIPSIDLYVRRAKTFKNDNIWNEDYNSAVGVEIEFAERFLARPISTDAYVEYFKGSSLFLGLKEPTHIWNNENKQDKTQYLTNVNLPADISSSKNEIYISFLDDGLQQASFYSNTPITFKGDGFKMIYDEAKKIYTFSKTGTRSKLTIVSESQKF